MPSVNQMEVQPWWHDDSTFARCSALDHASIPHANQCDTGTAASELRAASCPRAGAVVTTCGQHFLGTCGTGLLGLHARLGIANNGYAPLGAPDFTRWNVSIEGDATLTRVAAETNLTNFQGRLSGSTYMRICACYAGVLQGVLQSVRVRCTRATMQHRG